MSLGVGSLLLVQVLLTLLVVADVGAAASPAPVCTRSGTLYERGGDGSATLTRLANQYGTDKARHGYTEVYERLFGPMRERVRKMLEVGVFFGASLKMWREYFGEARLYGMDMFDGNLGNGIHFPNADAFLREQRGPNALDRIELVIASQANRLDLVRFAERHLAASFDIILDDGGHGMKEQHETFAALFHLVRPGGFFVVEDVHSSWQDGRDVLADGSNSFLLMSERYLSSGRLVSPYLSEGEREFLEREIGSLQIVYTNNNESCVAIFRRASALSTSASPHRPCNPTHTRSFDAQGDAILSVSYSNSRRFDACARGNTQWTREFNSMSSVVYSHLDFDCRFEQLAAPVLAFPFGGGYYIWKPYVIQNALRSTNADIMVYCDACSKIIGDVGHAIRTMPKSVFLVVYQLEDFHREHIWTKQDLMHYLGCNTPECTDSAQICATHSIWRPHDPRALAFTEAWLEHALVPHRITDSDSVRPNHAKFRQHRWDQSIFSILVKQQYERDPTSVLIVPFNNTGHHAFG